MRTPSSAVLDASRYRDERARKKECRLACKATAVGSEPCRAYSSARAEAAASSAFQPRNKRFQYATWPRALNRSPTSTDVLHNAIESSAACRHRDRSRKEETPAR